MQDKRIKKALLLLVLMVAVMIVDQLGKYLAVQLLTDKGMISLCGDTVRFLLIENHGGFLSLGASLSQGLRTLVFSVVTSVFLLIFFFYVVFEHHMGKSALVASGLILGGGIGNLLDRLVHNGGVIDFANLGIGRLRTGIFNIADMAVLFGVLVLFWAMRYGEKKG